MSSAELQVARKAAALASALLKPAAFVAHTAQSKRARNDLVTDFDRQSEAIIVDIIRAAFPDDSIVAEEGATHHGASSRRWFIDPLDGTVNFSHGLPFFAVSISLELDGNPSIGVVEAPALKWSFYGERNHGAFFNGQKMQVSATASLEDAVLATGFPYDRKTNPQNNFAQFLALKCAAQGVRRVGAAALDLAMVAAGWLDGYWEMRLQPWDLAAGALLVREAGGQVSNCSGGPFAAISGEAVASNGKIHDQLLTELAKITHTTATP